MTYCWKCPACGNTFESSHREGEGCSIGHEFEWAVRDYATEFKSQQVFIPGYMKSSNTTSRNDFLPTAKDFERPGDSDGSKGMKEWKDTHHLKREV